MTARREYYEIVIDPVGYVAPPLKGIWASAPLFTQRLGSYTLALIASRTTPQNLEENRPQSTTPRKWATTSANTKDSPPDFENLNKYEQRRFYNHDDFGKRTDGHDYPSALSEEEHRAVLEYLKTL